MPVTLNTPSSSVGSKPALPLERLSEVEGWGMAVSAPGYVYRPESMPELEAVLALARNGGRPLVLRGAGRSYGDAALGAEAVVCDTSALNSILSWDPETGVVDAEPGVTIGQLWRHTLVDGWWPAVVPGTMFPTLGGCLAMNVHGKNAWPQGPAGEHCLELDLLLPSGERRTVSPESDPTLFHAVIGGFGQLALITRVRWRLKKIHSGLLEVTAKPGRNLGEMLRLIDDAKDSYEYAVGWIDAFPQGKSLGRGQVHLARHLSPGEDLQAERSLRVEAQDLPDRFFGLVPKSTMAPLMRPWLNNFGWRVVCAGKYHAGAALSSERTYRQPLAAFSFLLDYIPGWKKAYLPGGLIQHQSFVPAEAAEEVFRAQLELGAKAGLPSYLAVLKRHRPDPFLLSHGVDGFSLALDFKVTRSNRDALWRLVHDMSRLVVDAGGRFYPAKDAAVPADLYLATFPDGQLDRFRRLRRELDPQGILTSSLAQRLLG